MYKAFIKSFCLILCIIHLCISLTGCVPDNTIDEFIKSDNPIYIKTKACGNTDISYFEVNDNGMFISCGKFEPNVNDYYIPTDINPISYDSIEQLIEQRKKYSEYSYVNSKLEKAEIPAIAEKAVDALTKFEDAKEHEVWVDRIFVHEDECYISIEYNVNLQIPYSLLKYDLEKDELNKIIEISDEQIIGLKI